MAWRELVQQSMARDIERKRANPGVQNFGEVVRTAMALNTQKGLAAEEEARAGRTAARTAVYNKYPQVAAAEMGVDVPPALKPGEVPAGPPGMSLSKVQYDENGNPTTVYEPTGGDAPQPSWAQEQKIESIKSGLRRGKVVIGREFGEPSNYDVGDMGSALSAINEAGLDPSLFINELQLYDIIEERKDKKSKRIMQRLRDGRLIWKDTKEEIK